MNNINKLKFRESDKLQKHLKYLKKYDPYTPCIVTDITDVVDKCKKFVEIFPNIKLYYAVKAYYDNKIIKAMDDYVEGYDVASLGEIESLINFGINPERLLYSNPVKAESYIYRAYNLGVKTFVVQSVEEINKISRSAPNSRVLVRVKTNDEDSLVPLSVKFGCLPSEVVNLLHKTQECGLKPAGLTFHVGSQQQNTESWVKSISLAQTIINEANKKGINCNLINIGGGFPAKYQTEDLSLEEIGPHLNRSLVAGIEYIAEPGRAIVAESSVIISTIIGIEKRQGKMWVFLDVGLFQAFIGANRFKPFPYKPILYSKQYVLKEAGPFANVVLTGPSCDSFDIIIDDAQLPSNIKLGDKVMFPNAGAYTIVYGSEFNGFKIPNKIFINS